MDSSVAQSLLCFCGLQPPTGTRQQIGTGGGVHRRPQRQQFGSFGVGGVDFGVVRFGTLVLPRVFPTGLLSRSGY